MIDWMSSLPSLLQGRNLFTPFFHLVCFTVIPISFCLTISLFNLMHISLWYGGRKNIFPYSYQAVCLFVNDTADIEAIWVLSMCGVKMIAMRCAGFDNVDVRAAETFG